MVEADHFVNWVPGDVEGTFEAECKLVHLFLCFFERGAVVVYRLESSNRITIITNILRLKRPFHTIRTDTILQLIHRTQIPCPIRLKLPILSSNHSKLNTKPVTSRKFLNLIITSPKRGQSNLLRKICKIRVRKQGRMSKQFMHNIRLGGIKGDAMMSNILRRRENLKCQRV